MSYLVVKAAVSGLLVMLVSEAARRSPSLGGLIASLPLVSVLAILWMWREGASEDAIARHAEATFWFVLPSLPMFLLMPFLLRAGFGLPASLGAGCALTIGLYLATLALLPRLGVTL